MSLLSNYDSFWKAFIRPPRQEYAFHDLGPTTLTVGNTPVFRKDFTLLNKQGHKLFCSHFQAYNIAQKKSESGPCVVYLHCNSGSRLEALPFVDAIIPLGYSLFTFDFSGCGMSEGEFISLGWHEKHDVEIVLNYLRRSLKISKIALWGRSMGAATAILSAQRDPSLYCIVCDSTFSDINKLALEIGTDKTGLPSLLIKGALSIVKRTVESKANFDIDRLDIKKAGAESTVPALFIASREDSFVNFDHTLKVYEAYKGRRDLIEVTGDHNDSRDNHVVKQITDFINTHFNNRKIEDKKRLTIFGDMGGHQVPKAQSKAESQRHSLLTSSVSRKSSKDRLEMLGERPISNVRSASALKVPEMNKQLNHESLAASREAVSERKNHAFQRGKFNKIFIENEGKNNCLNQERIEFAKNFFSPRKEIGELHLGPSKSYAQLHEGNYCLINTYKHNEEEPAPPSYGEEDLPRIPDMRGINPDIGIKGVANQDPISPKVKKIMRNIINDMNKNEKIDFPFSNSEPTKISKNRLFDTKTPSVARSETSMSINFKKAEFTSPFDVGSQGYFSTPRGEGEIPLIPSILSKSIVLNEFSSPRLEGPENLAKKGNNFFTSKNNPDINLLAGSKAQYDHCTHSPYMVKENFIQSTVGNSSSSTKPSFKKNLTDKLNNMKIVSTVVKSEEYIFRNLIDGIRINEM